MKVKRKTTIHPSTTDGIRSPLAHGSKRTPEREALALRAMAKGLSPTAGAKAAGVDRITLYNWRNADIKACAEDENSKADFHKRWDDAVEQGTDLLEDECRRRAQDGVLKPVFQGGVEVGQVREFSDTLMILSMKGRRPQRYKDRTEVSGDAANPVKSVVEIEFVNGVKPSKPLA